MGWVRSVKSAKANRYAALQSGTIDATNLTPPFNFKAQESGLRELVAYVLVKRLAFLLLV